MAESDELTRLERLTTYRDHLETVLAQCDDGSKAAALSRELRALDVEIEKAGGAKQGSALDDLAARRASRKSEATGVDQAAIRKRGGGSGSD